MSTTHDVDARTGGAPTGTTAPARGPAEPGGRVPRPGHGERPPAPGTVRAALLVAEREVMAQVRSKSFLISTAVLLGAVLVSIVLGSVLGGRVDAERVAVVGSAASVVEDQEGLEPVEVADEAAAIALVESGEVSAAVLPADDDDAGAAVRIVALSENPSGLVMALAEQPEVELLEPPRADEAVRYLVSFGFGLVFLISATGFGSTIAQNTVQEKQSRVVELLLATVSARALLAGKILGNSVLAFTQTAAIAAVAVAALAVTGQDEVLGMVGAPLVWFVLFFLVGFVLLASIYAASASLVSRMEDVGTVLSPVMMLTMAPYFLVVFFNDNPTVLTIMSYVPFSAPVGMPVRLFLGEAAWWEPLVSLVVLGVTTVGVILLGATIYDRSLLRTGPRVRLREALGR
ncbi:ABC transporter permease [Cellulomonas carbonis]|uniref:Sodium ABC transporter permease n=1 Tax=Cellulomonas carbonis T26 TaxID=947969 RepID=A0A0A0BUR9_9CELL|nr:ABC transporter permease [Cellulomonas carbonis]KGM10889.1 sodium ABC transporter permease [Cellulomonas carbonis T26]GGC00291.1 ABC transporter permease [Cellulomonas carbonis]